MTTVWGYGPPNGSGGYDATFRAYGGEDLDLGYRLQEDGVRFVYNARAVGYHYHIKGFEAFCRDQERAGYAVARLVEEHPEVRTQKRVDLVMGPLSDLSPRKKLINRRRNQRLVTLLKCTVILSSSFSRSGSAT